MALLMKPKSLASHCLDAHHLQYSQHTSPRRQYMMKLGMGPAGLRSSSMLRRNRASTSKRIPLVSSVHDGTLSATPSSPSPSYRDGLSQAADSLSPPSSPAAAPPSPSLSAVQYVEEFIEKSIFNCRFLTLLGVVGSLTGSVLCFFKVDEATAIDSATVDVYLMGTVMLIFGMGLYELFISTLDVTGENCFSTSRRTTVCGSNLFGLFQLRERPKWLEIRSLDELKTKLGHVIVMILLVGMFEKSKKVPVHSGLDLLCFSASILLSSGCLYFLSKLHTTH